MTPRTIAIVVVVVLAVGLIGYGFGRYATPAKVEYRTVTEVQVKTEWKDRVVEKVVQGPVRTVTHTVVRQEKCIPGESTPVTDTTTVVDAGPVIIDHSSDSSGTSTATEHIKTVTITTHDQPRIMLQAGVDSGTDLKLAYNVGASYRLAGPFWAGAAYHITDRRLELRASFTF